MKLVNRTCNTLGAAILAVITQSALAHDPAEHAKEAAAAKAGPDCAAMQKMDMSKMDMKDPVMQAMHQKCMKSMPMDHEGHDMKSMSMPMDDGKSVDGKKPADGKKAPSAPVKVAPAEHNHGSH